MRATLSALQALAFPLNARAVPRLSAVRLVWLVPLTLGVVLRLLHMGSPQQDYYTATVVSMLHNLHNFAYGSFDPGGLVMVDKPPVAFWVQVLPVALFGPTDWAVALPQFVAGCTAIVLLYILVRRDFGEPAGTLAALALAVYPAAVWVDTRNETDGLLAFTLLSAAAAVLQAARTGRVRWVVAAAVLLGVAFTIKMLMAFIPLPVFGLYHLTAGKADLHRRIWHAALGLAVLAVTSLAWPVFVELTPAEARPYVGSTQDNSVFTLIFGHNGFQRFRSFIGPVRPPAVPPAQGTFPRPGGQPGQPAPPPAADSGIDLLQVRALFEGRLAAVSGWLLTPALAALGLASALALRLGRPSPPADDRTQTPVPAAFLLWGGWFLTGVAVLGLARATATHPYYMAAVGAPLAAVLGIGVAALWQWTLRGFWPAAAAVAAGAAATAFVLLQQASALPDASAIVLPVGVGAAAVIVMGVLLLRRERAVATAALAVGAAGLLAVPPVWALEGAADLPGTRAPRPGPGLSGAAPRPLVPLGPAPDWGRDEVERITSYIGRHGGGGTRYALAGMRASTVQGFIVAGVPAAALGGFSGTDPVLAVEEFEAMAERGEVRYFLAAAAGRPGVPQSAPPGRPNVPAPGAQGRPLGPRGGGPPPGRVPAPPAGVGGSQGPAPLGRSSPIEQQVRQTWEDVSQEAGLPLGTLYRHPGAPTANGSDSAGSP